LLDHQTGAGGGGMLAALEAAVATLYSTATTFSAWATAGAGAAPEALRVERAASDLVRAAVSF